MTPLYDALEKYIKKEKLRMHMPGHKGSLPFPFGDCALFDATELPDTGNLYTQNGPIQACEEQYEAICQSGATLLSAGGSTLCIQSMLSLFCPQSSKILIGRNCHAAAVNTAAMLDLNPVWLFPDEASGKYTYGRITPSAVKSALFKNPDAKAVYITSPDYFGVMSDIENISLICREHNIPLLVDNAHGAHLVFFEKSHPIQLGADACCDSLHKTLPALTGAALLHLKDRSLKEKARHCMSLFGSTSPSYLIMLSADLLKNNFEELKLDYRKLAEKIYDFKLCYKQKWGTSGICDPVRISLNFNFNTFSEAKSLLDELRIEPELLFDGGLILIPSPSQDLTSIDELALRLHNDGCETDNIKFLPGARAAGIREALFSEKEKVSIEDAIGRVAAETVFLCPPAVPLIIPGEVISADMAANMKTNGIDRCFVIK